MYFTRLLGDRWSLPLCYKDVRGEVGSQPFSTGLLSNVVSSGESFILAALCTVKGRGSIIVSVEFDFGQRAFLSDLF